MEKKRPIGMRLHRYVRRICESWQLFVLLLPGLAYLIIFHYLPMYGVQIAFKDYRANLGIWGSPWVGLKHFTRFLNYPEFWKILGNTVFLSVYSIATFPLAIVLALMLNEVKKPGIKKTVQMVTYAPHFISTVVVCSMLTLFLRKDSGLINNVLNAFGVARTDFLIRPQAFPHIYVWSGVWQEIGWDTIIYIAALAGTSQELIEAARIDGANRLDIILHVYIPAILPSVVIMMILRCGGLLSVGFEKAYLLQNSLNLERSEIISTYVYSIGLKGAQFSYSSAIGLFNTVVNVTFVMTVNAIAKKLTDIGLW